MEVSVHASLLGLQMVSPLLLRKVVVAVCTHTPSVCFCVQNFSFCKDISQIGLASLVAQRVKHLPAMQETHVRSLGWEDPLEKEMATLSTVLAWRIPWTEELGGLQSTGSERVGLSDFHFHFLPFFQIVLGPTRMDSF